MTDTPIEFKQRTISPFKRVFIIELDSKATLIDYPDEISGISTLNLVDSLLTLEKQLNESNFY